MVGRFIAAWLLQRISPGKLLMFVAAMVVLLLLVSATTTGPVSGWALLSIGLFNSIMFPTIFALGIERMGPMTNKAASLLIMAIVGGAIVPYLQGVLADRIGLHHSFILPLLCYGYIIFYGLVGSRASTGVSQKD